MTFLEKGREKATAFEAPQKSGKIIGDLMRERHANNVSDTKRRNIIKKKHAINLTTKHKGVITKWYIKLP